MVSKKDDEIQFLSNELAKYKHKCAQLVRNNYDLRATLILLKKRTLQLFEKIIVSKRSAHYCKDGKEGGGNRSKE